MSQGYALLRPNGNPVIETVAATRGETEGAAYAWLRRQYNWPRDYWEDWHGFIKAREARGWWVWRVDVRPLKVVKTKFRKPARKRR